MVFELDMGIWAFMVVLIGAIVLGVAIQLIGEARSGYEWVVTAIAATIGAIAASEFIVGWQTFEPIFDGMALVPALIGGLVVGVVIGVATRYLTGGSYAGRATA